MKWLAIVFLASCSPACSGGEQNGSSAQSSSDAAVPTQQASGTDANGQETGSDASDGACPVAWLAAPPVDPSIAAPADGGGVLLHAAASGTQNYACTAAADGGTGWTFVGPSAQLSDCNGTLVGHHFGSDGGAAFPEWQTNDGTYAVGHKVAAFTPDGGAGSVPWLLLQAVGHGGSGTLSHTTYVQRLSTTGGNAPDAGCHPGDTVQVPYDAQYYFYGP